jgi:putative phage-type endonuclease
MEGREKYIGGSDCAAILGLSRWSTPLQVWAEKTGNIIPEDISDRIPVEVGNELEDYVARKFAKETGKKVRRVNDTIYHPQHPFIAAHIDRRIVGEEEGLECKTASAYKAREWDGEEIPQEYILQCMHYLAVTGAKRWYIACLIGNHAFKWKVIERDEAVISSILQKEVDFWKNYIEPKVMPCIITASDSDTLYQLYPVAEEGSNIELGDEADRLIENVNSLYADYKSIERQMEKLKNELKAMLKESVRGETGKNIITWKVQSTERIDVQRLKDEQPKIFKRYIKTSDSRVLRYRGKKEE